MVARPASLLSTLRDRYIFVYVGNVGQYVSYHTKSVEGRMKFKLPIGISSNRSGKVRFSRAIRRFRAANGSGLECFITLRSWAPNSSNVSMERWM